MALTAEQSPPQGSAPLRDIRVVASAPSIAKQGGRPWRRLLDALAREGIGYDLFTTDAPGHATTLARECALSGCEMVVAVGGDGTIGEVVNGLMQVPIEQRPPLGILPLGRGNDFVRTLDFPTDPLEVARLLREGTPRPLDVGRMTCRALDGEGTREVYSVNVLSIGFAADVTQSVATYGRNLGGTWPYVLGLVSNLLRWKNKPAEIIVDGQKHVVDVFTVNVGNGRFYGGGMYAAPGAAIDDGLFDVVIIEGLSVPEVIWLMPTNYNGNFEAVKKVRMVRGSRVELNTPAPALVQIDGDIAGQTPATCEIHKHAVRLIY